MSDNNTQPTFQDVGKAETERKAAVRQRFVSTVRQTWIAHGGDPKVFEPTWDDFTQTTTFHGIRYIFDPAAFRMRRALWVLCVVAAIATFVIQVGMRAGDYFQYHTNVEVQVVYIDSVTFPAVTICNHNNFRLTETQKFGLYDLIDFVYKEDNISVHDLASFGIDNVDTEQFVIKTAHQLTDFIHSCRWRGAPCNVSREFVLTQTDMGVCYTFNAGKDGNMLKVTEPGAGYALSMILNIEQYEYSRGPHNDAGVKILLHDQSEFPMIQDLGFAVAPGTHTLVGVQSTVSEGMEEPYGSCDKLSNVSMSDCLLKCRTREITNICGCRAVYMQDSHTRVCNMMYHFGCVNQAIDSMVKGNKSCNCVVPCRRVTYEPSLSYAHLSKYNIDPTALSERDEHVKGHFLTAKEQLQRADPFKKAQDERSQAKINRNLGRLVNSLNASLEFYTEASPLGIQSMLDMMKTALDEDCATILELWTSNQRILTNLRKYWTSLNIWDLIDDHYWPLLELKQVISCSENLTFPGNVTYFWASYTTSKNFSNVTKFTWSDCDDDLASIIQSLIHLKNDLAISKNILGTIQYNYTRTIRDMFNNTNFDPLSIPEHASCSNMMNRTLGDPLHLKFDMLSELMNQTLSCETVEGMYNNTLRMKKILKSSWVAAIYDVFHFPWVCDWLRYYITEQFITNIQNGFADAVGSVKKAQSFFPELEETVAKIDKSILSQLSPTLSCMEEYSNRTIEKRELCRRFQSFRMQNGIVEANSFALDYDTQYDYFQTALANIPWSTTKAFGKVLSFQIPILNNQRIANLKWIALLAEHTSAAFQAKLQNVRETTFSVDTINDLTEQFFKDMIDTPHGNIRSELLGNVTNLVSAIEEYQAALVEYNNQCQMDETFFTKNFLQVDIFYKELKYERVVQRPAFQTLSLLSEVGGFLGLLLGASVLTVCELVDYLGMTFMKKLRQRKRVSS